MSWWDSLSDSGSGSSFWGDLFSSNSGGDSGLGGNWTDSLTSAFSDSGGSGSDVWGLDWGNGGGGGTDWSAMFNDGSGGQATSGSNAGWMSKFLNAMGGGGQGGGSSGGGIFGALLSGLSGAAGSWMDSKNAEKTMKMKGEQDRKTLAFTGDLQDYFKQKDKVRKRVALDSYGQFSQLKRWAPNYVDTPMPDQPAKPSPTGY